MALRILIVERPPVLRHGLQQLFDDTPDMTVTGCVEAVAAAEALPAHTAADVVLAGADVLDMDGATGITRLLVRFPLAQVVMLGSSAEPGLVVGAFRAGADGYLTRNITPDGLVRALRGVERGEAALPRALTYLLVEAIRYTTPSTRLDERILRRLSPRERDVLREIAYGQSNTEIALRLGVSESTVKTHVSNILRKTGSRSRFLLQSADRE